MNINFFKIFLVLILTMGLLCTGCGHNQKSFPFDLIGWFNSIEQNLDSIEDSIEKDIEEPEIIDQMDEMDEMDDVYDDDWYEPDDDDYYFDNSANPYWDGEVLNSVNGTVQGPSGKETYYNLPMEGVISIMRNAGYNHTDYPYWIREDGCKMLGNYIMVAADQSIRPLGTIVETSRGLGIVCDTGSFIYSNQYQLDLAVNW